MRAQWPAVLVVGYRRTGGTILDLSRGGARIEIAGGAAPGDPLTMFTHRLGALDARVVWCRGNNAGVAFTDLTGDEMARLRHTVSELERLAGPALDARPRFGRRVQQASRRG